MVRLKNRYLLVNILYPDTKGSFPSAKVPDVVSFHQPTTDDLTPNVLLKAIRAEVAELFGDYGSGAISDSLQGQHSFCLQTCIKTYIFIVKYLSPATSTFIIRVSRAHYRIAWAALSFMNTIPTRTGRSCIFRVVRVSGTIRKAEEEAIRRAREIMLRARREMGEQSAATLENILGKTENLQTLKGDEGHLIIDRTDSEEENLSDGDG
jgi:ribonuclease P/MRP protein subunit POP5